MSQATAEHRPFPIIDRPDIEVPADVDDRLPPWAEAQTRRGPICWTWLGPRTKRYGGQGGDRAVVVLNGETRNAARMIWISIYGPVPDGLVIRHSCDQPMCVRPSHLLSGTPHANTQDAVRRGRLRPGGRSIPPASPHQPRRDTRIGPECALEGCGGIAVPAAPVRLCPRHLREAFEFVQDVLSLSTQEPTT